MGVFVGKEVRELLPPEEIEVGKRVGRREGVVPSQEERKRRSITDIIISLPLYLSLSPDTRPQAN